MFLSKYILRDKSQECGGSWKVIKETIHGCGAHVCHSDLGRVKIRWEANLGYITGLFFPWLVWRTLMVPQQTALSTEIQHKICLLIAICSLRVRGWTPLPQQWVLVIYDDSPVPTVYFCKYWVTWWNWALPHALYSKKESWLYPQYYKTRLSKLVSSRSAPFRLSVPLSQYTGLVFLYPLVT